MASLDPRSVVEVVSADAQAAALRSDPARKRIGKRSRQTARSGRSTPASFAAAVASTAESKRRRLTLAEKQRACSGAAPR